MQCANPAMNSSLKITLQLKITYYLCTKGEKLYTYIFKYVRATTLQRQEIFKKRL